MTTIISNSDELPTDTPTIDAEVQTDDEVAILSWILATFPDEESDEVFDL